MPIGLVLIGIFLIRLSYKNTLDEGFNLAFQELLGTGTGNYGFLGWAAAIVAIASLGIIAPLRPVSNGLLWLIFVSILLSNNSGITKTIKGFGT